jgi:Leucine-rich repeat (LRR) protein
MNANPKPRWFRFSLRTLLVLVTMAGAGFGWLGMKMRQAQRQKEAVEAIQKLGGVVTFDYEEDSNGKLIDPPTPPGPAWLRDLLGDGFFANVTKVHGLAANFPDEATVHLQELRKLKNLDLNFTDVTDVGLADLQGLTDLQSLDLAHTQVTDDGLVHVQSLRNMQWLSLTKTEITDAGVLHLKSLIHLRDLYLLDTQVSNECCKELQKALPNVTIHR